MDVTAGSSHSSGSGAWLAGELLARLIEVVEVEVGVAERVHEVADLEARHLGHHVGEQRVGRDVERHAEEDVGRALVQLAGQPSVGHVELEERMARRERHVVEVGDVPGADDVAARVGVGLQRLDDAGQLVDGLAVRRRPRPPLVAVDGAELAGVVGPLVPDGDAVLAQPPHVGVAGDEPEQLADDGLQVDLLRGDQREAVGQREPHLVAEDAAGARAGAVALLDTLVEDPLHQIEVRPHVGRVPTRDRQDRCAKLAS